MNLTKLNFPDFEQAQLSSLNRLFSTWHEDATQISFDADKSADDMVFDGFFPYFSAQTCKILFIGRESLGLTGEHYLDLMHHCYKTGKIGEKGLNQSQFHALMLRIAYGLNHNCCSWDDIPAASEIAKTFATADGMSFAFMNLSKFSNESDDYQADWQLIDSFINSFAKEKENYFTKQIEIINPDIIVTMNLEKRLKALGELSLLEYTPNAAYLRLKCAGRDVLLMDLHHFSAVKVREETFYRPILNGITLYR
ncbi:hypothetical protein JAO78_007390 [Alishewanella sp. 16-MA]|uniref:Uncharacterized protein n=1 Tax=Alishewanella maricola TaxID=2795740 RepID=A0ABS8C2W7_9ALTE|nr:hypothetical protein [Alishewanella maricola]MCB5226639.1 hypothetical protein [Alishewanella maricola]